MLSANKERLVSFFSGNNQFKIPFFQRSYVWKEENWNELWEDIVEELEEKKAGNTTSEHFIGTIIIKQTETSKLGSLVYDLIDGQQRLTTICLLLKAIYDFTTDAHLKNYIYSLVVYIDPEGNSNIRIIHSKVDSEYFSHIMLNKDLKAESLNNNKNRINQAYLFFYNKLATEKIESIKDVIEILLQKLPVIHMALSKDDDVQQIFDTINSLGVKLTTGELLKNYLFSFPAVEPDYGKYWHDIFEADEETIQFWETNKTAGRVVRSTIELFLYSYLVVLRERSIKIESLFKEYKEHLKNKTDAELIAFAKELSEYALIYAELPDGPDLVDIYYNEHEKRFFHLMNELDITTVFPLVLFIYKNVKNGTERSSIMSCLESYLVRRTVCKLTTKNYNNLFISIMVDLKKQKAFTATDFKNKLRSFKEDTNRFPDDTEFKRAFFSSQLINQYSKEVLYCIALYQLGHAFQDTHRLDSIGLTVEHIMPKKWRNNWVLPSGANENTRDAKLLTLGNLTLVKGRFNSSLRDSSWTKKRPDLIKFSKLRLTTDYLSEVDWNETVIDNRASALFDVALSIWKR